MFSLSVAQDFEIPESSFQDVKLRTVFITEWLYDTCFLELIYEHHVHNSHASLSVTLAGFVSDLRSLNYLELNFLDFRKECNVYHVTPLADSGAFSEAKYV